MVVGDGGMYARIRSSAMRLPVTPLLDGGRQLIYVLGIDTLCLALRDTLLAQGAALRGEAWNLIQPQPVTLREMARADTLFERRLGHRASPRRANSGFQS